MTDLLQHINYFHNECNFRYENRWDRLATDQAPIFLGDHAKEMADEVTRLFKAFDSEAAQSLLQENLPSSSKKKEQENIKKKDPEKKCVVCQKPQSRQRCARCRNERYCGRECQVNHWPKHKSKCKPIPSK